MVFLVSIAFIFPEVSQLSAKTVTDQLGREVTLPDDPRKIVSLAPSITEIVYALGRENRLKGVTRFSDFPEQASELPRVGSYVHLDLEKIVALKPDLCFAIKDGNPKEIVDRLESLGIPVYVVNPRNLESVMETLLEIGGLLNAAEKAEAIVARMKFRINRVNSLVARISRRPRVFFQIGISPIVSAGTRTFIHELILLAGGENLAQGPYPYPRFSKEQVLALSPEVIIISSMARDEVFDRVKAEWSRWPGLPAVREGRILLVDSNVFDRPTPRLVEGLELLVKLIHPEFFEENH